MIEWDICGRGEGKTTRMLEWQREDPEHRIMVVRNQARRLSLISHEGIDKYDICTIQEVLDGTFNIKTWEPGVLFGIDDFEHQYHVPVGRISATGAVAKIGPTEADLMMARNGLQRLAQR